VRGPQHVLVNKDVGDRLGGERCTPAPLAANLIDRARSAAVLTQLGATVVPMTSATLKVPRVASGLVPDWRNENAPITDKAVVLDAVTLTAQSLACMVKVSWELLDDAPRLRGSHPPGVRERVRRGVDRVGPRAVSGRRVGAWGTTTRPGNGGIGRIGAGITACAGGARRPATGPRRGRRR